MPVASKGPTLLLLARACDALPLLWQWRQECARPCVRLARLPPGVQSRSEDHTPYSVAKHSAANFTVTIRGATYSRVTGKPVAISDPLSRHHSRVTGHL